MVGVWLMVQTTAHYIFPVIYSMQTTQQLTSLFENRSKFWNRNRQKSEKKLSPHAADGESALVWWLRHRLEDRDVLGSILCRGHVMCSGDQNVIPPTGWIH